MPDSIVIEAEPLQHDRPTATLPSSTDGAEFLRAHPDIAVSRNGGHGHEIILRGQQQDRIAITADGAYLFGGCPNRMDPPAAYAHPALYDDVVVQTGLASIGQGTGGSAGAIRFERRHPPELSPGISGSLTGGYRDNSDGAAIHGDLDLIAERHYLRFKAAFEDRDDYEDGSGHTVPSTATTITGTVIAGWRPHEAGLWELSLDATRIDDARYAGSRMDAPRSDHVLVAMRGSFDAAYHHELLVSYSDVDHLMDNYSLRVRTAPMAMRTPTSSRTITAEWSMRENEGDAGWSAGLRTLVNQRDARRYAGSDEAQVNALHSLMWPDVTTLQISPWIEHSWPVQDDLHLIAGLRGDLAHAEAADTTVDPAPISMMMDPSSPDDLYRSYYGVDGGDETVFLPGALLRCEYEHADTAGHIALSITQRPPDASERYLAGWMPGAMAANRWVGNPDLDAERHQQLDLGIRHQREHWDIEVRAYWDEVHDYILRDRARGQSGIHRSDGATIYRNVNARLLGGDVRLGYQPAERWRINGDLAYTYGINTDDHLPLAQIPPLSGSVTGTFVPNPDWITGLRLRWAARQHRVDASTSNGSGLDSGETAGYGVWDCFVGYDRGDWHISGGARNIFDSTYADHVNRSNLFEATPDTINEPGLDIWLEAGWRF